ncbi:MAG: right-handed parallel beta-helix repeat-containing protein [Clostridiales bacterium]|jgi:hypothetical protein|nr:right-handed parallel beta-helix repeat-containing protein [Clostridiales bacterium]
MIYYVSCETIRRGIGTKAEPFKTIGQAAEIARAGDSIVIGKGVYREWVDPRYGGLSAENRITYTAEPGETPVISGAEEVTEWEPAGDGLWKKEICNTFFGEYNPFSDAISGDWYDGFGKTHHTGEVYINGKAMYEAASVGDLRGGVPEGNTCRWYAAVSDEKTVIWANFNGENPNECCTEINVRPCCFLPKNEGVNYITVSGLWLRQCASQWAPPTAFQQGALGVNWSKGWIIENCIISNSKCSGISIGKRRDAFDNSWSMDSRKGGAQTYTESVFSNLRRGWSKDSVGSHIIRNNEIYDCGQTGIVGCMGGIFSVIEGNHIHDINNRGEFGGAEMAGIKLHAAIDTHISNNCIHDCHIGLWLDWQAQGARVSGNAFFANIEEDLFIEVCHGPCVADNNLLLSEVGLSNMSQGSAFVHNLIAGKIILRREVNRFTLYHLPHDTYVGGVMLIYGGDDRVANNIFINKYGADCESGSCVYNGYRDINSSGFLQKCDQPMFYKEDTLPVDIHDNLYFNHACKYESEHNAVEITDTGIQLSISKKAGVYYLSTDLFDVGWGKKAALITSDTLGHSFESGARYENPDSTPLIVDEDFSGNARSAELTHIGPFEEKFTALRLNHTAK